jgi:hypothetical protein
MTLVIKNNEHACFMRYRVMNWNIQDLGLPCPDDRVLLWPRHPNLTSEHLIRPTHGYCDVHFFSYVNNAACVCLSLHMVCAVYICRRQGINYDIPSYFYLIFLHTPPSTLLLPHTVVSYTIHKPPTTFFDIALCPDVFVSWFTSRPVQMHTSCATCTHCASIFRFYPKSRFASLLPLANVPVSHNTMRIGLVI